MSKWVISFLFFSVSPRAWCGERHSVTWSLPSVPSPTFQFTIWTSAFCLFLGYSFIFHFPIKSKASWLIICCLSSAILLSENPLMIFHYIPTNGIGPLSCSFQMRKLRIRRVRWLPIGPQLVWDGPGLWFQMCPTPIPGLFWHVIWAPSWRWRLNCVELDIVGEGRLGWRIMSRSSEVREHLARPQKRDPWMKSLESWCFRFVC